MMLARAALISMSFSGLIVAIELTKAARSSLWGNIRSPTLVYFMIVTVGNVFTTFLAVASIENFPVSIPKGFGYAFVGVFGFEALLKNINLTFAGIGVLSIDDWITKAKDAAVADVIEADVLRKEMAAQRLAQRLRAFPTQELNAHVNDLLGNGQVQALEQEAQQANADPQFVKALALAKRVYPAALAISPESH